MLTESSSSRLWTCNSPLICCQFDCSLKFYIIKALKSHQHYNIMQAEISAEVFFAHVERVQRIWAKNYVGQFDSIILVNGKTTSENEKTVAILSWLFAYNLADTILFFTEDQMIIFTSERKIAMMTNIKEHSEAKRLGVSLVQKQSENMDSFGNIWKTIHSGSKNPKVGMLTKDEKTGLVAQEFQKFLEQNSYQPQEISHFFNECLINKTEEEISNLKKSALVTTYFLDRLIKEIEFAIDQDSPVKHSELCQKMQKKISNENELKKCSTRIAKNHDGILINKDFIDIGAVISIQSGGRYNADIFVEPDHFNLKPDCILLRLGTLYKSYNSCVARTLLINPTEEQKSTYKKVLALGKVIQQNMRPGVAISSVYKKASDFMKQYLPDCEVPKSFGFGTGIFLYEPALQISEGNSKQIEAGFSFFVNCTLTDLKTTGKKGTIQYAVQVLDTVVVSERGQEILTAEASNTLSDITYELGDQDEDKKQRRDANARMDNNDGRPATRTRKKHETTIEKFKSQKIRNEHQMELKKKKLEELKDRVHENFMGGFKRQKNIECAKLQSYKARENLPKEMKKNQIYVDSKNNSLLLPISGRHIPFHIHTLKNVVKNDEGKYTSLRFNFHLPGGITNLTFPKYTEPCVYVKEMVFRSLKGNRIAELEKQVKNLQKKVKMDMSEKHAKEDIVEQEGIKLNKGKRPILRELFMRPNIGQKKVKGILECHFNGFRYTSSKGEVIDVTFSNIRFAFFQPCERQIIAAIHFRLYQPIIIGKKKSEDVQFYSEGGQMAEDVGGRGRFGGEDDDDEERQKQSRRKLDRQFMRWVDSCDEFKGKHFTFEIPDREKGFYGNPFNNNTLLQPTKTCLVNVAENKVFIAPLEEIEITVFERMCANLRYFDMILIMKDYENFMKISQIPIQEVEKVKDWLDSENIIFYDQSRNLNWIKFLATIRKDFRGFVDGKAWMAWDEVDQEEEENDLGDDDSFRTPEGSDFEESSDDDDESESNYAEEESDDSEEEEESEEGLQSEEMDERAEMEDREKERREIIKQKQREKERMMKKHRRKH